MANIQEKIANGWNAVGDLLRWREIDPPKFRRYRFAVASQWFECEGQRNDSTGFPKKFGKPYVIWTFGVLTEDELQLLRSFGRYVTIYAYNKTAKAWKNFNAEMILEPLTPENWRRGHWVNVRVRFMRLEEIP